tara:strand:+ start:143 stop:577 length:435 start_codon:yes stop_codon:yes gene_type:complete
VRGGSVEKGMTLHGKARDHVPRIFLIEVRMNLLTHLEHRCGKRVSRPVQRHGKTKLLIRNTLCHVELKWWIRLGRILQHVRQLRAEDARLEWSEDTLLTGASSGASHNVTERIFIEVDVRWGTTGSRSAGELKLLRSVAAILKY